jgi:hypothetical protein
MPWPEVWKPHIRVLAGFVQDLSLQPIGYHHAIATPTSTPVTHRGILPPGLAELGARSFNALSEDMLAAL